MIVQQIAHKLMIQSYLISFIYPLIPLSSRVNSNQNHQTNGKTTQSSEARHHEVGARAGMEGVGGLRASFTVVAAAAATAAAAAGAVATSTARLPTMINETNVVASTGRLGTRERGSRVACGCGGRTSRGGGCGGSGSTAFDEGDARLGRTGSAGGEGAGGVALGCCGGIGLGLGGGGVVVVLDGVGAAGGCCRGGGYSGGVDVGGCLGSGDCADGGCVICSSV